MTDRLPLGQHTDDTLTELYDQRDQLRVMYDAASEREHDLINERDRIRTRIGSALACMSVRRFFGPTVRIRSGPTAVVLFERKDAATGGGGDSPSNARVGPKQVRTVGPLEVLTDTCMRLLRIYANGLDHGRQVDAANVAHRIRRILTGLDDRPLDDEELRLVDGMRQQNLDAAAAAIQRAERAEAELAEARALVEPQEDQLTDTDAEPLALTREQVRLVRDTCDRLLNQAPGERTRWLHVVIEGGDEYTANRSALSLRDWLQAEFGDGIAMRITTDAREQDDTTEGSAR